MLDHYGTDAAVVVQAGDTTGETLDLLALAGTTPRLAGVVGWVDLDGPDVRGSLAALHTAPGGDKLVAVRHQLQVEADPRYLARPGVRNGLTAVAEAGGLAFDVVVSPWQLPLATETAAALPGVRFVLDHAGKPPIASGDLRAWRADLARLAELPNVAVKVSGLVTEADCVTWTQADLAPVIDHVLACFGTGRTMAGSDWPVCLLAADYAAVRATLDPALGRLDQPPGGPPCSAAPRHAGTGRAHDEDPPAARPGGHRTRLRRRLSRQSLHQDVRRRGPARRRYGVGRRRALLRHRAALRSRALRASARRGAGRQATRCLHPVHQGRAPAGAQSRPCGVRPAGRGFAVPDDLVRRFDFSRDGALRSLESSLGRLGVSRIDIVYVHDPDEHLEQAITGAVPALTELRDQGVIGVVGVGMNQWQAPLRMVRETDLDLIMLAGRWTLIGPVRAPLLAACAQRGVDVVAAAPFNSGLLAQ